jgi:protein associated with RNAse G/E
MQGSAPAADMPWQPGDLCALRGIVHGKIWTAQAAIVVKDSATEVALALVPGAQCYYPAGYVRSRHNSVSTWSRWDEARAAHIELLERPWESNEVLMLYTPGRFYSVWHFRDGSSGEFLSYYVNFELPWKRTSHGFDTLDLDLDLVVAPDLSLRWKDEEDYLRAVAAGDICAGWAQEIERARADVLERVDRREHPFDGAWLNWHPEASLTPPRLPHGWDKPDFI